MRHFDLLLRAAAVGGLVLSCAARPALAQPSAPGFAPGDSLRIDPTVRTGVLPNGLHFFIRPNHRPEHRVELWLALAAGSTLERDDQRGLAHFCEHMNFNGTTHFKPEELTAYLESIGLRFGADANASTSFDETIYSLQVPTDRDTLLDRGLLALADFAGGATLSDEEIRKERGVVLEEWRLGRGAGERMWRKQLPALYHGSRYVDRDPIGLPEIIEKAPAQRIREFYHAWYTPDRMAVIAAGDVDPARMDSLIRVHFGALRSAATREARKSFEIPLHKETLVAIATDKEATGSSVRLVWKHPHRGTRTVAQYRSELIENLYGTMLNARFAEIGHRADPPFLGAGGGASMLNLGLDTWVLSASVSDGKVAKGLAALIEEVSRVRRHGFLPSELARAREQRRKWIETAWAERDKSESSTFALACLGDFIGGEPQIGIEATRALDRALLDGVTLDEVNALTPRLMHEDSRVVLVNAPEKPGAPVPTEAEIRDILARTDTAGVAPWIDQVDDRTLVSDLPPPGSVRSRRVIEPLGVTVLTLSNGVEVWLKPTDFQNDEILVGCEAMGGVSVADTTAFWTASLASPIVSDGGVGGFTSTDLQKRLAGKVASVSPYAAAYTHGLRGRARPADLETALQLIHLYFTRPTENRDAFTALRQRILAQIADRANSPDQVFADTISWVNSGGFYMYRSPSPEAIQAIDLSSALDVFRKRYSNAADFTFTMVGSFREDSVTALIARYLGSLPSTGTRTSAFAARGPRFPRGVRTVRVNMGTEPRSSTVITFFANGGLEELDMHRARACAAILTECLRRSLREMLGGTYSATASFSAIQPLPGFQTMTIEFGCDPARTDSMVAAALAEVRRLREEGPSLADVQKDQEIERRELEVSMKQNTYWIGSLQTAHQLGWDPLRILKRRERIDLLTPASLKATFVKYFPPDRYTVITLAPKPGAAGGN